MTPITAKILCDLRKEKIKEARRLLIKIDKLRAEILSSDLSLDMKAQRINNLRQTEVSIETSLIRFKAMQLHDVAMSLDSML